MAETACVGQKAMPDAHFMLELFQQKQLVCWRGECRRDLRLPVEGAPDAP